MQSLGVLLAQNPFHSFSTTSKLDKAKQIVSAIAIPILVGLGSALCAASFFPQLLTCAVLLKAFSAILPNLTNSGICGLSTLALGVTLYVRQIFAFTSKNAQLVKKIDQEYKERSEEKLALMQLGFDISESQVRDTEKIIFPQLTCQLTKYELNAGSIKRLFLAFLAGQTGCFAVSKLEEGDPSKFNTYALSDEVFAVWRKVAAECSQGGLGQIIDKTIVQIRDEKRIQYLVQPFFNRGNLFDRLRAGNFGPKERAHIALDLMRALASMHRHNLVHGDIKPDNIQLHFGGERLGAFIIDTDTAFIQAEGACLQAKRRLFGAPITWAPEMFAASDANLDKLDRMKTDVWALGLIFMMLFVKEPKFLEKLHLKIDGVADKDKLRKHFQEDNGMTTPAKAVKEFNKWLKWNSAEMLAPEFDALKPVLVEMLNPSADKRINASDALEMLKGALTETSYPVLD